MRETAFSKALKCYPLGCENSTAKTGYADSCITRGASPKIKKLPRQKTLPFILVKT